MAGLLDIVDRRTQLVGQNRLELLLFSLGDSQYYGINVFKVREVIKCPTLHKMPNSAAAIAGVAHIRGETVPMMNIVNVSASQQAHSALHDLAIITEYNRSIQGFLVNHVDRIVNVNWRDIHPPPAGTGDDHYLTAVTRIDSKLVEILDVEKILAEVSPYPEKLSETVINTVARELTVRRHILVVDDSLIARKQVQKVLESIGISVTLKNDGKAALEFLQTLVSEGKDPYRELLMVICDIEMPEMDGYTFTQEVRGCAKIADLHIILHTSLSGVFNRAMVKKIGADDFVAKFNPDELVQRISKHLEALELNGKEATNE